MIITPDLYDFVLQTYISYYKIKDFYRVIMTVFVTVL